VCSARRGPSYLRRHRHARNSASRTVKEMKQHCSAKYEHSRCEEGVIVPSFSIIASGRRLVDFQLAQREVERIVDVFGFLAMNSQEPAELTHSYRIDGLLEELLQVLDAKVVASR
jgi:hypothetical protein